MVLGGKIIFTDLSKSEREALKAIYRHTKNGADAHTGDLAETLSVAPGTVTATVKRLADRGLVDHRPYHGVSFTAEGRRHAVAAIRRHRIVERFLADQLHYSWREADRLAPTFEHELPDEVEERMYEVLGQPEACPHGFPIPNREQDSIPEMPTLYELEVGDAAVVALPSSTDADIVGFLSDLGVRPGVEVTILEKHPFEGPLVLQVNGHQRTLGERVARHIYVRTPAAAPAVSPPVSPPVPTPGNGRTDENPGADGTDQPDRARAVTTKRGPRAASKKKEGTAR